jgi:hypothetical protein
MPRNTTTEEMGVTCILVRTTGTKKTCRTVMLSIIAVGRELLPDITFKRKTMPKRKFPSGIHVRVQEKG